MLSSILAAASSIYFGTTVISCVLAGIGIYAIAERMEKDGLRFKRKNTTGEKLIDLAKVVISMLVPVRNVLIGLALIYKNDEIYEEMIEKSMFDDDIEVVDKKETEKEKEEKTIEANGNNQNISHRKKSYSEMTLDEKLEFLSDEREALLEQKYGSNNNSYNDRGPYTKKK